jgi:hypothetical protein
MINADIKYIKKTLKRGKIYVKNRGENKKEKGCCPLSRPIPLKIRSF